MQAFVGVFVYIFLKCVFFLYFIYSMDTDLMQQPQHKCMPLLLIVVFGIYLESYLDNKILNILFHHNPHLKPRNTINCVQECTVPVVLNLLPSMASITDLYFNIDVLFVVFTGIIAVLQTRNIWGKDALDATAPSLFVFVLVIYFRRTRINMYNTFAGVCSVIVIMCVSLVRNIKLQHMDALRVSVFFFMINLKYTPLFLLFVVLFYICIRRIDIQSKTKKDMITEDISEKLREMEAQTPLRNKTTTSLLF